MILGKTIPLRRTTIVYSLHLIFHEFFLVLQWLCLCISANQAKRNRSSSPEVLLGKDVLEICSKCAREHPSRSVTSIKLLCSFIEIILRHGCSPVNLLHIFKTPFPTNTSGWVASGERCFSNVKAGKDVYRIFQHSAVKRIKVDNVHTHKTREVIVLKTFFGFLWSTSRISYLQCDKSKITWP